MIDIATERLLNLREAAKYFPSARQGKATCHATIWRKVVTGELEGLHLGTHWVTSVEAIQRWAERQTEAVWNKKSRFTRRVSENLHGKRRKAQLAKVDDELDACDI